MKYLLIAVVFLFASCMKFPTNNYSSRHLWGSYCLVWQDGDFKTFLHYSDGQVHFSEFDSSIWFSQKRDLYRMAKIHWGQVIAQRKRMGLIK